MDRLTSACNHASSIAIATLRIFPWRPTDCSRGPASASDSVRLCRPPRSSPRPSYRSLPRAAFSMVAPLFDRGRNPGGSCGLRLEGVWMHVGTPRGGHCPPSGRSSPARYSKGSNPRAGGDEIDSARESILKWLYGPRPPRSFPSQRDAFRAAAVSSAIIDERWCRAFPHARSSRARARQLYLRRGATAGLARISWPRLPPGERRRSCRASSPSSNVDEDEIAFGGGCNRRARPDALCASYGAVRARTALLRGAALFSRMFCEHRLPIPLVRGVSRLPTTPPPQPRLTLPRLLLRSLSSYYSP